MHDLVCVSWGFTTVFCLPRRFALIKYNSILGKWDDEMMIDFEDLLAQTSSQDNVIQMTVAGESLLVSVINMYMGVVIG